MSLANMHRVLSIPEMLDLIFGLLNRRCNINNACVCKQWSEVALDTLWRDVDDLARLFCLLAPFQSRYNGYGLEYTFSNLPEPKDWVVFEKYGRRVRRLRYSTEKSQDKAILAPSVFADIARTRTSLNILPQLLTLEWTSKSSHYLNFSILFMHENVKQFIISLPQSTIRGVATRSCFQDIIARMPLLTLIDLRADGPVRIMEQELVTLFSGLPKLQKVVLPRFYFTSKLAEALSPLEHLEVVEFQYREEQGHGAAEDVASFAPSLSKGAFPRLYDLSLSASLEDMTNLMKKPHSPTSLTILYVDSPLSENPATVHEFLSTLAETSPILTRLDIDPFIHHSEFSDQPLNADKITFDTLRPLLSFNKLASFHLVHHYPLDFSLEDLEELCCNMPLLEKVTLNNEPVVMHESPLNLHAFLPFARHCPNLVELGLFINATSADIPPYHDLNSFRKPLKLNMGASRIAEAHPVALFLSEICPLGCTLDSGVTWDFANSEASREVAEEIARRCEQWDTVAEFLPVVTRLRIQERERTKALQAEVEDLRIRTRLLMERATIRGDKETPWLEKVGLRGFFSL